MSSEDIEKGRRWQADLSSQIASKDFAIVCLTPENKLAPWILFEAGALSKRLINSRICPYLHELSPAELNGHPLGQFQSTTATKDETRRLVLALYKSQNRRRTTDQRVRNNFEQRWDELARGLLDANSAYIPPMGGHLPKEVKVLVVDDEVQQRELVTNMIVRWGMVAESAAEGFEALERIPVFKPDIVLTDLNMPGMGGFELLTRLVKHDYPLSTVVLSGYGDIDRAIRCTHELGAFWYLEKPIRPEALLALLRRAAIHSRLLQGLRATGGRGESGDKLSL